MAIEILIIADDLTGAADTAVQFSKQGIRAALFPAPEIDIDRLDPAIKVVAVDTESRHCPQDEAYHRVKAVAEKARARGCRRFYKKIDSTFRGNVGAELESLMAASGAPRLALVPAYPAAGRTTGDGYQYVNGMPLNESVFARDPREPVSESYIPAILGRQTSLPIHRIGVASVRAGKAMTDLQSGIFLFDAITDDDLCAIAKNLDKSGDLDVVAGAAGFAETLAGLYRQKIPGALLPRPALHYAERLLIVNGSLNDVSLGQVADAKKEGVRCFLLPKDMLPGDGGGGTGKRRISADAVVQCLNNDRCAMVTTAESLQDTIAPTRYADLIGGIVSSIVAQIPAVNVAVFGGDTAAAVCRKLGCNVVYPCDEIMPGLTVCLTRGNVGADVQNALILKSGGFGSGDVINKIKKYLKIRGEFTK